MTGKLFTGTLNKNKKKKKKIKAVHVPILEQYTEHLTEEKTLPRGDWQHLVP